MTRWFVFSFLLLSIACGDDGGATDAAPGAFDSRAAEDASTTIDAAPGTPDGPSADAKPSTNFGPVDCRTTADCLSPTTCTQSAPGGICGGCGNENQCASYASCPAGIGACVRDCTVDGDCSAGKRCAPGTGRCILRNCSSTPCPAPYACGNTNFCQRPACGANNSCTMGFTCDTSSQICMEP